MKLDKFIEYLDFDDENTPTMFTEMLFSFKLRRIGKASGSGK